MGDSVPSAADVSFYPGRIKQDISMWAPVQRQALTDGAQEVLALRHGQAIPFVDLCDNTLPLTMVPQSARRGINLLGEVVPALSKGLHLRGAGQDGIVLHSKLPGEDRWVSSEALAHLFKAVKDNIRVVVLNACFSHGQAAQIVKEIDFVVGMADSIGMMRLGFSRLRFTEGSGSGGPFEMRLTLESAICIWRDCRIRQEIPVLMVREGADADTATLLPRASA